MVDSYGPITASLNHARARYDLPALALDTVRLRVGRGLETLIGELVGPDRIDEGVRLFRERYAEVFAAGTAAYPGVSRTLARLHGAGLRLAVASNKPTRFTRPILEGTGLARWISSVQGPAQQIPPKPAPVMIRTCLEELGVESRSAMYVGDMLLDVESAARAGLPVALVQGGSAEPDSLRQTGERCLSSLMELTDLLGVDTG